MSENIEEAEVINEELPLSERMESFIGTKVLKAVLMTKAEYNEYRGWDLPEDEDPNEPVYMVEYQKDPTSKPNHKDHEGYISMSPIHVFEKAYSKFDPEALGSVRTGAKFDPESNGLADRIRNKAAELIDLLQEVKKVNEGEFLSAAKARLVALAQTDVEMASMCGVKATFTK